ncbi:MAG: tail fiber protein, partial [Limisphaerales bacterium]
ALRGSVTLSGTVSLPKSDATTNGGFVPVGGIIMWSGTTLPAGWALCDGTTTNGLVKPDLRGRFVLGSGSGSGLTPRALTDAPGGEEQHILTVKEMPKHTHDVKFKTFNNVDARNDGTRDVAGPDYDAWNTWNKFTSEKEGGDGAHNNMPPYYVLAYIIRVQ